MRSGADRRGWPIRCLPAEHWAAASDAEMAQYPHDVARAQRLFDEAGFPARKDGVRLRITLKTSTDETTRLMAAGAPSLSSFRRGGSSARYSPRRSLGLSMRDVTRGAVPDVCAGDGSAAMRIRTSSATPGGIGRRSGLKGEIVAGTRTRAIDALMAAAAMEIRPATGAAQITSKCQKMPADDLPGIPLWYPNNQGDPRAYVIDGCRSNASGTFDFLRYAWIRSRSHFDRRIDLLAGSLPGILKVNGDRWFSCTKGSLVRKADYCVQVEVTDWKSVDTCRLLGLIGRIYG